MIPSRWCFPSVHVGFASRTCPTFSIYTKGRQFESLLVVPSGPAALNDGTVSDSE